MITQENSWKCPGHIVIFGGGRWARVLVEVLCSSVPSSVKISVHSPHNAPAMLAWSIDRELGNRIQVYEDSPKVKSGELSAVIVANAARDHEKAIKWALSKGLPVLVEKPITLSSCTTEHIANLAIINNTYLASAHVFLFAKYVNTFLKLVAKPRIIQYIRVRWIDPQAESRYGEIKSYDPGLPVYIDWLPHIVSILDTLHPDSIYVVQKLEVLSGGSHLKINICLGESTCEIELVRNGNVRSRLFEIDTQEGKISLDFSNEPGQIISGTTTYSGDPAWGYKPKPVCKMLRAFLRGAAGGERDVRLDIKRGLRANKLIDQLSPYYQSALSFWLSKKFSAIRDKLDPELHYTLCEFLYGEDPYSLVPIKQRIKYLYWNIKKSLVSSQSSEYQNNPAGLIRLIIKQGKTVSYLL